MHCREDNGCAEIAMGWNEAALMASAAILELCGSSGPMGLVVVLVGFVIVVSVDFCCYCCCLLKRMMRKDE